MINTNMLAGVMTVVGVITGAILQHFLSKSRAQQDNLAAKQAEAYADYLKAVSAIAFASNENRKESLMQLAEAKARISIYGSDKVIAKLSEFENAGAILDNPTSNDAFVNAIVEMRRDGGAVILGDARKNVKVLILGS